MAHFLKKSFLLAEEYNKYKDILILYIDGIIHDHGVYQ